MMVSLHHREACLGSNGLASYINDLGTRDHGEIRARTVQ
jgi:hypothetical protein